MTFLTREFGLSSERVVDGVDGLYYGHWNWIELMNYLYLVFELGRTAKTNRAPHMFRVEDTLSPTSHTTHFSAL